MGWVPEHDKLSRHVARQSVVMLKNEGNVLPLKKTGQKIALIGWWVEDQMNAEGCGVIWGNHSAVVTLAQGMAEAIDDPSNLRTVHGSGVEIPCDGGIEAATQATDWADVVVLAFGEPKNYSGEAQSRTDIVIPDAQMKLAEAVAAKGKPMVVLLKNGRALALDGAVKDASAILVTWFLGKMQGNAIADLLFGDFSPSGRLPVSFPIRSGQQPFFYNHMSSGRPCVGETAMWKNCWRQIRNEPLYPFGHGLTYTSFDYSEPTFSSASLAWDGAINITATVTNVGDRAGEEVVQLYMHDVVASKVRPIRELKGFRKISLQAGESRDVTFTLTRHDLLFAVADPHGKDVDGSKMVVEPGAFDVWISPSATTGESAQFELEAPACTAQSSIV